MQMSVSNAYCTSEDEFEFESCAIQNSTASGGGEWVEEAL